MLLIMPKHQDNCRYRAFILIDRKHSVCLRLCSICGGRRQGLGDCYDRLR